MALNNIELGGKQMRIERPRDYAPMSDTMLDQLRSQVLYMHIHAYIYMCVYIHIYVYVYICICIYVCV